MAYGRLATNYSNWGESGLAIENARKAYELRQGASQRARFYIESRYEWTVNEDFAAPRARFTRPGSSFTRATTVPPPARPRSQAERFQSLPLASQQPFLAAQTFVQGHSLQLIHDPSAGLYYAVPMPQKLSQITVCMKNARDLLLILLRTPRAAVS